MRVAAAKITALHRQLGAVACTLTALVAAGCGSSGPTTATATAPECLSAGTSHSAQLSGTTVDVSPAPGTDTADPHTQISFEGDAESQIGSVSVVGTRSGRHDGRLEAYSQGDGASFVPARAFSAGEHVTVRAVIAGRAVRFSFGVERPWSTAGVGEFANQTAPASDYQTFSTLPGVQAPTLTVTVADHDPGAGDILTSNGPGPGRYGPLIYTPQGQLVWFDQLPAGITAEDVNVQSYDGQRDLTYWRGRVLNLGFGQGADVVLNSRYQTVATVTGGNGLQADLHEFQVSAAGVAYITAYNPMRCDLRSQGGARNGVILDATVMAIDIKTGLVRWEWHALDHIAASESETSPPASIPWDWFHINSIDPEPNGDLLISARNTWAVYQLQQGSGQILWRLGGLKSSFAMGPGTKTYWQHDARMLANGNVTIFDDGSDPPQEAQSRGVQITLDLQHHSARLVSALTHPDPPLLAASQGNMQTLASGDTVVGYGGVPYVSEYSASGALLFDAHLPLDQVFYRAYRQPWSGRPTNPPAAVANLNNTLEETIVRVSWNGATGVDSWRVLAGTRPTTLAPQATVASAGFETEAILPRSFATKTSPGYVEVEALDSSGAVLGSSRTIAVRGFGAQFPGADERNQYPGDFDGFLCVVLVCVVLVCVVLVCEPFVLDVFEPPHPATNSALAPAASAARVTTDSVRFTGQTPVVAGGAGSPHYQPFPMPISGWSGIDASCRRAAGGRAHSMRESP